MVHFHFPFAIATSQHLHGTADDTCFGASAGFTTVGSQTAAVPNRSAIDVGTAKRIHPKADLRAPNWIHVDQIAEIPAVAIEVLFANQVLFLSSKARARLQTFSTVNPYSRISTGAGADAPKWSRPITSPRSPT